MLLRRLLWCVLIVSPFSPGIFGQVASQVCPRAAAGSIVPEPHSFDDPQGLESIVSGFVVLGTRYSIRKTS
jgi:hypothetical protein